jgi:hypothetical protein
VIWQLRLNQHCQQSLGGLGRPTALESPFRGLGLKYEAQSNSLGTPFEFRPQRSRLGFECDRFLRHELMSDGKPLTMQALGYMPKSSGLIGSELSSPAVSPDQNWVGLASWIKTEAPTRALLNLQAQPGSRAG